MSEIYDGVGPTDWNETVDPGAGNFPPINTHDAVEVVTLFVEVIQDTSLSQEAWLDALRPMVRNDTYLKLEESSAAAAENQLGEPTEPLEVVEFPETGKIAEVHVTTDQGQYNVMVWHDAEFEPWLVIWWEKK